MKIVLASPSSIPARRANTIQVMKMAQAMTVLGHEVDLLSPLHDYHKTSGILSPHSRDKLPGWDQIAEQYGLVHKFRMHWLPVNPRLRSYDFSYHAFLWARKNSCEVFYTRLIQSATIASLAGMSTVLEIHDLPGGRVGPIIFRLFLRGRGSKRLVVITKALAADLTRNLNAPPPGDTNTGVLTIIAPDGVDLERYSSLPNCLGARQRIRTHLMGSDAVHGQTEKIEKFFDEKNFIAGYTGHLYKGRGIELILEMARRLADMQFLIVGGEEADVKRVNQTAEEQGLDNMLFTGFIPNSLLPNYQSACDVLIMPYGHSVSASSGGNIARYLSPMKLFEYMACERPILSSNLPPLREVLNEKNSFLLPSENPESWTEKLLEIRDNPDKAHQLAQQAREDVNQYTWESRARKILEGLNAD